MSSNGTTKKSDYVHLTELITLMVKHDVKAKQKPNGVVAEVKLLRVVPTISMQHTDSFSLNLKQEL